MSTTTKNKMINALVNAWEKAHTLEQAEKDATYLTTNIEEWKTNTDRVFNAAEALLDAYHEMGDVVESAMGPVEEANYEEVFATIGSAYAAMYAYVNGLYGDAYGIQSDTIPYDDDEENA